MITSMQVTVDQMIPSRGVAICKEVSSQREVEVFLLPMRVGRMPRVGEQWIIDRTFRSYTFAALVRSDRLADIPLRVGPTAPSNPQKGDRWCEVPVKVWDGTDWVEEA